MIFAASSARQGRVAAQRRCRCVAGEQATTITRSNCASPPVSYSSGISTQSQSARSSTVAGLGSPACADALGGGSLRVPAPVAVVERQARATRARSGVPVGAENIRRQRLLGPARRTAAIARQQLVRALVGVEKFRRQVPQQRRDKRRLAGGNAAGDAEHGHSRLTSA